MTDLPDPPEDPMKLALRLLEASRTLAPAKFPLVIHAHQMVAVGELVLAQAETIRRLEERLGGSKKSN